MSNFVGQEKIFNIVNSYKWDSMPHTLLFLGDYGAGKKTMSKYLANKLGFKYRVINSSTTNEDLISYQQSPVKTLYLIDLSEIVLEKEQNKFLKFIEDPFPNVYTVLINTSEIGILPTILNRCTKLRFEQYTIEQLKQIKLFNNELAYRVCTTPGQLNSLNEDKLLDLYNLCDKIINILPQAEYANVISVTTKINYKEDYNKFEFDTFFNTLELVAMDKYLNNKDKIALKVYKYTAKRLQELVQNGRIQKEPFMINFLDGLWKEVR